MVQKMYWSTVQNYVFLLTLAKLMRTFTDQMQKMLRVVLVYIIKHLWNMWKARVGLLGES
jgi:hypothetical protein